MRRRVFKGLIVAAFGGVAVVAGSTVRADDAGQQPAEPPNLWWRMPGRADMDRAYPAEANRRGISGSATVVCRATPVTLTGCRVQTEEPTGLGFGKAAVSAARWFTTFPNPGSSSAREVSVRIDFVPPRRAVLEPQSSDGDASSRRNLAYWDSGPPYDGNGGSKRAREMHVAGRALVRCRVSPNGKLSDCDVMSEDPVGWGFGKGAISTVSELRLARKALDGSPTLGRMVEVPVTSNPECSSYPDPNLVYWCAGLHFGAPHFGSQY